MQIALNRYLRALIATILFIVVGFLITDDFGVLGVAIGLFWLLVTVVEISLSRKNSNRQTPVVR